jgi:uncharacterized protein YgiM (DUF1202 family)
MAGINIKLPEAKQYRGWMFVFIAGFALTIIAMIDQGGFSEFTAASGDADGSTGCIVTVQVAERTLNLRDAPTTDANVVGQLDNGSRVDATTEVQNEFRRLEDGRWASTQYLVPEAGSTC